MGLLDLLSSPDYGLGLLGMLNPLPQQQPNGLPSGYFGAADPLWNNPKYGNDTKKTTDDLIRALREGGESPLIPQRELNKDDPAFWNQPGITYSPSVLKPPTAPSPFDTRTVNAPIFGAAPQASGPLGIPQSLTPQDIAAANGQAPPQAQPGQLAPQPALDSTGFFAPPSGAQAPLQPPTASDFSSRNAGPQPQAPQPAPQAPVAPQGGNGMAALMNFFAGRSPMESIGGAIGGAMTGQRLDQVGQQQQVFRALTEAGASPNEAMAAAVSPELFRQIAPQYFSKGQPIETGIEPLTGQKSFATYDAKTHTLHPLTVGGQGIGGAANPGFESMRSGLEQARQGGATPAQLYQMVPEAYRGMVQALIEGRALPANIGRSPVRAQLVALAHEIDPSFNENEIAARQAGWRDWYGGGKSSETARKLDQSALHFGELVSDKMANLPGHMVPAVNGIANTFNTQVMGKGAENAFLTNAHALADELGGLFKGSNLSDSEIKAWEAGLSPNMSLEQQRTAARTLLGLYRDGLSALEKKRVDALGPVAAQQKGALLGPDAEAALKRVEDFAYGRGDHAGNKPDSVPSLKVGQSHTIGNVTIKKVAN